METKMGRLRPKWALHMPKTILLRTAIIVPLTIAAPAQAGGISPGAAVGIGVGSLLLGGALAGSQPAWGQGYGYGPQPYQPQYYDYGYQQPQYGYDEPGYGYYSQPQYQPRQYYIPRRHCWRQRVIVQDQRGRQFYRRQRVCG
jgi:hypothetical protein